MPTVTVTKKDVIWSYVAQFFNLGIGLITLPAILKLLNPQEIGLNYILISISSVIALFDMGFSSQIGKNITYVLSGAQTIEKEGVSSKYEDNVNEKLLACVLRTAKSLYQRLSIIAMLPLLTLGTYYVWKVTDSGHSIDYIIHIWIVFCASCFFNIYFLYYNAFLQGRGLVKENKQGQILSRIVQIVILLSMLLSGCGLLSVIVANFIAPFVFRYYARIKFYDRYIKEILAKFTISSTEIKSTLLILLYNAKKMGVIGILSSALGYASTLIVGSFLQLSEVGSYGVLIQILGIIGGVSTILFYSIVPELSQYMVTRNYEKLRNRFGFSIFVFLIIQLLGFIGILCAPYLFRFFRFETQLPSLCIVVLFFIYKFIELNQSLFSQLLVIGNNLIFYMSSIITGITSVVLQFLFLYIGWGLIGIFFAQMIPLGVYCAWKWPIYTSKQYKINIIRDIFSTPMLTIQSYYGRHIKNCR